MCFALFLGSRVPPPIVPCSDKYGFHFHQLGGCRVTL